MRRAPGELVQRAAVAHVGDQRLGPAEVRGQRRELPGIAAGKQNRQRMAVQLVCDQATGVAGGAEDRDRLVLSGHDGSTAGVRV